MRAAARQRAARAEHPWRKSDVSDARWLADLLAHGLVWGSFVPPPAVQEMRDLTRTRKQLVRESVQHTQWIQKTLEDANIKVDSVISDILGASGRAFVDALIGEKAVRDLEARMGEALAPFRDQIDRLKTIPGSATPSPKRSRPKSGSMARGPPDGIGRYQPVRSAAAEYEEGQAGLGAGDDL
jgi:hypothetical protein